MIDPETGRFYSGRELNNGVQGVLIKVSVAFAVCVGLAIWEHNAPKVPLNPAPVLNPVNP